MQTFSSWEAAKALHGIDRAVVAMERRGFSIDVGFCNEKAEQAARDEIESLDRIRERARELGHDVGDEVWSSPKQQAVLFHDELKWPRSPIWKKGRVKPGETKLDATALEWISGKVPAGRALIKELIHLKRIRLCGDWLRKLPEYVAPDGRVHPVCGPAGDGDDRVGAKTGRLGIKNPSSNFPKDDETEDSKDLYGVRRAIVAPPGRRIIEADYDALEVFIQADMFVHLFGDYTLAHKVADNAPDIHSATARAVFGEQLGWTLPDGRRVVDLPLEAFKDPAEPDARARRFDIKEIRYGRSYGKTVWGFATSLRDDDGNPIGEKRAQAFIDAFLAAEPGQAKWEAYALEFIRRHRCMVGYDGRVLDFSHLIPGDQWQEAKAQRRAQNIPQVHGAAIIGRAMTIIEEEGRLAALDAGMILQLHDAIVAEAPEEKADEAQAVVEDAMRRAGERWMRLKLRTSGGHGATYADC